MSELTKDSKDSGKQGVSNRSSNLGTGRERFLAYVIEHGFEIGRRTPEDFVRLNLRGDRQHGLFPPQPQ